jgi:predicted nuclease of predicted toxin-antitoxin system
MKLYLDEDSEDGQLAALLRKAGQDVQLSAQAGLNGQPDPRQLMYAIDQGRVLLSANHHDFLLLHQLVVASAGHHPGILIIRKDNDPRRDLSPRGVCLAISKLEASGVPIGDNLHVLNHWRR